MIGLLGWISFADAQPAPRLAAVPAPGPGTQRPPGGPRLPPQPRPLARLTAKDRATAVQRIQAEIRAGYVFPELRAKLVEQLERSARAGRYDVDDPMAFAERITDDLRAGSKDGHLGLLVDPPGYAAALSPPKSDDGIAAFERRRAIREHHGLQELRRLPGNVRYLRISGFQWVPDETGAAYDDAMRFLKDGDAIIIDLRGNGGGDHSAVQYLVSHFLPPDTLEETFMHAGETSQSRTLAHVPAGRLQSKPLYVLIDGRSASAAEAFAYDVEQFKLGELVGATTAGAANNNKLVPIAPGFLFSLSFGRPVHPVSKSNWEGVGIKPTIASNPTQALDAALAHVLGKLAQQRAAGPEALAEYAWARTAADARLRPPTIDPAQLASRAGRYGEIEVVARDGALHLIRPNRPDLRLAPLTADGLFSVEGTDYMRVQLSAKALDLLWLGRDPRRFPRS